MGVWCVSKVHAEPSSVLAAKQRLDTIEQLKQPWSVSEKDQRFLWTNYWQSRMGLTPEDPDIFERILVIQSDLAAQYPTDTVEHLLSTQISALMETGITLLQRDFAVSSDTWTEDDKTYVQDTLSAHIEHILSQTEVTTWVDCWKSDGGSVGIELFRASVLSFHQRLITKNTDQALPTPLSQAFSLDKPIQADCPRYKPAQVEGASIPKQPTPVLVKYPNVQQVPLETLIWITVTGFLLWGRRFLPPQVIGLAFALWILVSIEGCARVVTKPLIQTTPMFHTQNWQVVPWIETETEFWTQGSYLRAQRISKTKSKQRLVILGASSAHGSNELWENSFAGLVADKGTWEVVNMGIGGTTSAGILALTPYVQQLKPNAIMIYYGHNEVHQIRQLTNYDPQFLQWYPIQRMLWSSSIYTLLHQGLPLAPTPETQSTAVSKPSHNESIDFASEHFENNIALTLQAFADIPVLLCTPPTNYPFAPMTEVDSLPPNIDEIQALIDNSEEATTIHSSIKSLIPTLAKRHGITHWDIDRYFHQNSPDGTSANGLFWDELHPSALGHQWIATGVDNWLHSIEPSNQGHQDVD